MTIKNLLSQDFQLMKLCTSEPVNPRFQERRIIEYVGHTVFLQL
jgi:hypothetical protein